MLKDLIVKIVFDVFITHLLFRFKFINSQIGFPILGGSTENDSNLLQSWSVYVTGNIANSEK